MVNARLGQPRRLRDIVHGGCLVPLLAHDFGGNPIDMAGLLALAFNRDGFFDADQFRQKYTSEERSWVRNCPVTDGTMRRVRLSTDGPGDGSARWSETSANFR